MEFDIFQIFFILSCYFFKLLTTFIAFLSHNIFKKTYLKSCLFFKMYYNIDNTCAHCALFILAAFFGATACGMV